MGDELGLSGCSCGLRHLSACLLVDISVCTGGSQIMVCSWIRLMIFPITRPTMQCRKSVCAAGVALYIHAAQQLAEAAEIYMFCQVESVWLCSYQRANMLVHVCLCGCGVCQCVCVQEPKTDTSLNRAHVFVRLHLEVCGRLLHQTTHSHWECRHGLGPLLCNTGCFLR